jgi:hypothetical protein
MRWRRPWARSGPPPGRSRFTGGRILAEWRAAERELAELRPDSPEAVGVRSEIERLRVLYQDLFRG